MIRFKKAAMLLCDRGRLISEVSYELGFSSPKYFTIRFKKQFGQNADAVSGGTYPNARIDASFMP